MAGAFKTTLGTGQATTSGTTIVITTTAAIDIGDLVVVRWASDNLSATTPTATCADGGNTYTVLRQAAVNATAAAGVAGGILATKATVARPSGSTITVTLSGAVAHKCAYANSFTGVENTTRVAAVGATGTATAASAGATAAGILAGDLVLGHIANETRGTITGDSDTVNGSWSTQVKHQSATSGTDSACVSVAGQYKIATAGGAQTYNVTAVGAEWVCQCVVLQATPDPAITQAAFQFFDDAGTESGAASLAALNTAVTGNLDNGDGYGVLRVRLQSTTAVAVPSTDDFQLQWERNSSGTWTNVTTGGTTVRGYDNPNLTDGAATTNRLGAGSGSFVAGKITETGDVPNMGWTANNYTELVYSLTLRSADLLDGDVLRFRVLRNGATSVMTYTQTPLINIENLSQTWAGSTGTVGVEGTSGSMSSEGGTPPVTPQIIANTGFWDSAAGTSAPLTVLVGDLLAVVEHIDSESVGIPVLVNSGTAFTWTQEAENRPNGTVGIRVARATAAQTMTISFSGAAARSWAYCWQVRGAHTSDWIGAAGASNSTSDPVNPAYTAQAADSLLLVGGIDWNERGTITSSDLTETPNDFSGWCDAVVGYKEITAAGAGTFNLDAAAASPLFSFAYVEILPAPSTGPQTWTGSTANIGIAGTSGSFSEAAPPTGYSDDFNRANGSLGSNWVARGGASADDYFISSNKVHCYDGRDTLLEWSTPITTLHGYVQMDLRQDDGYQGLQTMITTPFRREVAIVIYPGNPGTFQLERRDGGAMDSYTAYIPGTEVTVRLEWDITPGVTADYRGYINDVLQLEGTLTSAEHTASTFKVGFGTYRLSGVTTFDNFLVGELPYVPPGTQTWAGSTGTIGVAGISGSFVAAGTTPSAPLNLTAIPGNGEVVLDWDVPSDGGTSAITDYIVQYRRAPTYTEAFPTDGTLGAPWVTRSAGGFSDLTVVSGRAQASSAGPGCVADRGNLPSADHWAAITMHRTSRFAFCGLLLRNSSADPRVEVGFEINDQNQYDLAEFYSATHNSLYLSAADAAPLNTDIRIRGEIEGTTARYYVDDVLLATRTLTTALTGTKVGFGTTDQGGSVTSRFDNFETGVFPYWTTFSEGTGTTTAATVTGLTNLLAYEFRVAAVNGSGQGPWSNVAASTPTPPPQTWTGSTGTIGVAGTSGSFVAGAITWIGSAATTGMEGTSAAFVAGAVTWTGSTGTVGVAGLSGTMVGGATTWVGSTAQIGVAGTSGAFTGGAVTWAGSTATVGAAGITGVFTPSAVTWVGSTATIGVAALSGNFTEANIPQTWVGSAATVGVAGTSGSFLSQITWAGSTATVGVAGTSGSFTPGAVTWIGTTATIGVTGVSGAFSAGAAPQTWTGSLAEVGVTGITGSFTAGAITWVGSVATIGVAAVSGVFFAGASWTGSVGQIGVAGQSGAFVGGAVTWTGSAGTIGVTGTSDAFAIGAITWTGSTATIGVTGISAAFVTGAATWTGSTGTVGVAGTSGAFLASGTVTWLGSTATIGVTGISGTFGLGAAPQVWVGSLCLIGLAGTSGTWETWYGVAIMGLWNGQVINGMQYGDKEVLDWMLIPS